MKFESGRKCTSEAEKTERTQRLMVNEKVNVILTVISSYLQSSTPKRSGLVLYKTYSMSSILIENYVIFAKSKISSIIARTKIT